MAQKLTQCPVCGKDILAGMEHPECIGISVANIATRVSDNVFVFTAGANLDHILATIEGKRGFYVRKEQFDYEWHNGSKKLTINVTDLLSALEANKILHMRDTVAIDPSVVLHLIANGSVDDEQCARITPDRLQQPVIFIQPEQNVEGYILADGQHRYVANAIDGNTELRAYIVQWEAWQPYGTLTIKEVNEVKQITG